MNILDENNFVENMNGRVIESQLSALKERANIWVNLLLLAGAFAIVGYNKVNNGEAPTNVILTIAAGAILVWLSLRVPALLEYYFLALTDSRNNHIAHTTAKLDYRNGYILQAEDVRLSLLGDKNSGLIAGNVYEVFYLPIAKVAISARVQQSISESQQAHEITLLFGKVIGFAEEDIAANRNGKFPLPQRLKILKKNWPFVLAFAVVIAYTLLQVVPMLLNPAFIDDAIIFTILNFGLMFFFLGVIYLSAFGAQGVFAALLERRIEQVEGVATISSRIDGIFKSRRERYYFEIPQVISLEISKHVYDSLVDGLSYRIFYTPRAKYLVSAEVLKV